MVKQRKESAAQYKDAGRSDLEQREVFELAVIAEFMPEQFEEDEISELVAAAIAESGASTMKEMGRVARSTSIPIATGERLATKYEFAELLERQGAAILQPALGRVGGILEAKKIAGMAEAHYAELAPHLYCGPIEAAANIQIATCSPNFLIQESIERVDGFHAELLKNPIQWEDGYIIPPTEPGLGVELDEQVAAANPYDGPIFIEVENRPLYQNRGDGNK